MSSNTDFRVAIIRNALGADQYGHGSFRNRFYAVPGSTDHLVCMEMVRNGEMVEYVSGNLDGKLDNLEKPFEVTDLGKQLLRMNSPDLPMACFGT